MSKYLSILRKRIRGVKIRFDIAWVTVKNVLYQHPEPAFRMKDPFTKARGPTKPTSRKSSFL